MAAGRQWPRAFLAVALLALALAGCQRGTPEERLRAQVAAMQQAVEEKRTGDFMAGVSEDFAGEQGMDRAALHNLLRVRTLGNAEVGVTTGPLDVQMQGDRATVRFSTLLSGGSGRLLPERMQTYRITTGWRLEDGQWRVHHAQWDAER